MKTLVILVAIFFGDPTKTQPQDTVADLAWLEQEWKQSQIEMIEPEGGCSKIIIVNLEGDVVLSLDELAINNKLIAPKDYAMYSTSDFLFENADGDRYYLKN